MKKFRLWTWLVVLMLVGCEEPYEIDLDQEDTSFLAISGELSNLPGPYKITIVRTGSRYSPVKPITTAKVVVHDSEGGSYTFRHTAGGNYSSPTNLVGTPGIGYWLTVEIGDESYATEMQTIPEAVITRDTLSYGFVTLEEVSPLDVIVKTPGIELKATAYLQNENQTYYQWKVSSIYSLEPTDFPDPFNSVPPPCFIGDTPEAGKINLLATRPELREVELTLATQQIDYTFNSRRYYIVEKRQLNSAAYTYWKQLNELINQTGSVFDVPPARLQGNIRKSDTQEFVAGYFGVYAAAIQRIFVTRGNLPERPLPYCEYSPNRDYYDYPAVCLNCLSVPNSTLVVPDWWLD